LRAAGLRALAGFAMPDADLARVDADRDAADPPLFARVPVERLAAGLRAPERAALVFRPVERLLLERAFPDEPPELARAGVPSSVHLPDITR
jgi:hypothetical protein